MAWQLIAIVSLAVLAQARYENVNVKQDWWEAAVIYQIYTRSFMDSNGDGIGDLKGITSRLDYLNEMKVDAVCLSPIFKSPLNDYGFDVSDYYSIHPDYGTIEDLEYLIKKGRERNIKVILDIVPNHTSNESDWFLKSANKDEYYSDWYIWESGHLDNHGVSTPPNNWISTFGKSAWTYVPNRDQYYLHQFGPAQPDLNFRNPVLVDELKNIMKFWLEKGVAGMRMTSVNHLFEADKDMYGGRYPDEPLTGKPGLTPDKYGYLSHIYTRDQDETYDMISQFRDVFDSISVRDNVTRVLITEACTGIKNSVKYYGEGTHSGSHIPINLALINDFIKGSDARGLKFFIDRWITYKPLKAQSNWMSGNHDKSRVASRLRPALVDAYNMLVLLLPGIALTYMVYIMVNKFERRASDYYGGWYNMDIRHDFRLVHVHFKTNSIGNSAEVSGHSTKGEEIGMVNGVVTWTETRDPLACNTDDPVNFVDVTRDPARTPFQWSNAKNSGFSQASETWLPVADGFELKNVAIERSSVRSHYQVYRALATLRLRPAFKLGRLESIAFNRDVFAFKRWYNDDAYVIIMNVGKTYSIVNLTAFDLIFGQLEVEISSVLSTRTTNDVIHANYLDLASDEALVLRMQV